MEIRYGQRRKAVAQILSAMNIRRFSEWPAVKQRGKCYYYLCNLISILSLRWSKKGKGKEAVTFLPVLAQCLPSSSVRSRIEAVLYRSKSVLGGYAAAQGRMQGGYKEVHQSVTSNIIVMFRQQCFQFKRLVIKEEETRQL